jgi:hypothetical protein
MPFKDSSGANCTLASGNGSNADTLFVFVPANTLVLKPGDARWLADWIREWDDSRPPDEEPRPDGERGAEFVADELARVDLLEGVLRTCWRHGLDQERALELLAAAGKELAAGRPKEPAGDA